MTGLALAFINAPIIMQDHPTFYLQSKPRFAPSDHKITDMRYAVVMNGGGRCPVIRIEIGSFSKIKKG